MIKFEIEINQLRIRDIKELYGIYPYELEDQLKILEDHLAKDDIKN